MTTPENEKGLVKAVRQVLQMVKTGTVTAIGGEKVFLKAQTVCIHGDGAFAVEFARTIREKLVENRIAIRC